MSIVKTSNSWTIDKAYKKKLDIRRLKHNDVTFEGPPNYSKTYFINIFRCFDDHQIIKFIFINLLHSPAIGLFVI